MTPFPSTSYIRKAHFSFSLGDPADVTSIANRNSCIPQVHACTSHSDDAARSDGGRSPYLEVDVTIFVRVECPEHVIAELFGISTREEHFVHVDELGRRQLPIWAILLGSKEIGPNYV